MTTAGNSNDGSTAAVTWPENAFKSIKLQVPLAWRSKKNNDSIPQLCVLDYDATERLIKVVDAENTSNVLDIIDADDVIGAAIEIGTASTSNNRDGLVRNTEEENEGRASNEPQSNMLTDTQGSAVLSIYVYPREDSLAKPSLLKRLSYCSAPPNQPQPTYQRVPKSIDNNAINPRLGNRFANHRKFTMEPVEDFAQVQEILKALNEIARTSGKSGTYTTGCNNQGKSYLVIINPVAGPKKNAVSICNEIVKPMLEQAGIETTIIVTTHAKHATEICTKKDDGNEDITKYDGLVLLGGDGIIHEVLNGIQSRSDKEFIYKNLSVGVIGCGTGNGMAISLAHASKELTGPINESFLIAKGQIGPVDLSEYEILEKSNDDDANASEGTNHKYISFLTFSWAYISDVDLESECIRWMGATRFDVWAVWRIISLRKYKAKLSYLTPGENISTVVPPVTEPVPSDWQVIDGNIIMLWASHVTHAGPNICNAPDAKLNDGLFHIIVARGEVSRYRMLQMVLAVENGSHVNVPGCEMIKCSAFRLEQDSSDRYQSKNNIDGEAVANGIVQARVIPSAFRMFYNEN